MIAIPHAGEPFLDSAGRVSRSWRAYLSSLTQDAAASALQQQINQLWEAINTGDGDGTELTASLQANGSIEAVGTLASGVVILSLTGDIDAPGASYYYGTDASGLKGWHSLGAKVQSIASTATVTPNSTDDVVVVSAQAAALTIANPTGTEEEGQGFVIRIKDNGTSRALTWGSEYRPVGGTLPTATVAGEWLYFPCSYNSTDDKWDVFFDQVGSADTAQVQTFTTATTVTPLHDDDMVVITALASALTIANPTGIPTWADGLVLALKDNGTSRALTWGADYRGMGATLFANTTVGKWMYFPIEYNQADSKWDVFPPTVQQ